MHKYRPDIDGLRALAVYSVILFHFKLDFASNLKFTGGFIGVDIFFVISGYLISSIIFSEIDKNKFSLANFYNRRARRILPVYILISIVSTFFSFVIFLPGDLLEYSKSLLSSIFFSSNFFFWQNTGYFFENNELKPLIHTWSLSVEEQFYIIFPICLLISLKYFKKLILPLLITIFLISLILSEIESSQGSAGSFFLLPTRCWELISGVLCCFYLRQKKRQVNIFIKDLLSFLGLMIILLSIYFFNENFSHPGLITLFPVGATMLIIIFCDKNTLTYKFLSNRVLVFNGLISYSLYMWHQPFIAFLNYYKDSVSQLEKIVVILIIFMSSFLSWKFIEKPVRDFSIMKNKQFYKLLTFTMLTLLLISFYGVKSKGLLYKFDEDDHHLLLNNNQYGHYVWQNSARFKNKLLQENIEQNKEQSILIIGDSFSQDILNSFLENDVLRKNDFSWTGINTGCKKLIKDIECLNERLDKDKILGNNIKNANLILFSMSWTDKNFQNLTELRESGKYKSFFKKLIIIGSKNFEGFSKKQRKKLINLSKDERMKFQNELDISFIRRNQSLQEYFGNKNFISLIDIFCDLNKHCKTFSNNKLISYDGSHLTKEGAILLGEKLVENEIIKKRLLDFNP